MHKRHVFTRATIGSIALASSWNVRPGLNIGWRFHLLVQVLGFALGSWSPALDSVNLRRKNWYLKCSDGETKKWRFGAWTKAGHFVNSTQIIQFWKYDASSTFFKFCTWFMSVVTYSDGHRVFRSANKAEVDVSRFNTRNGLSISLASLRLASLLYGAWVYGAVFKNKFYCLRHHFSGVVTNREVQFLANSPGNSTKGTTEE